MPEAVSEERLNQITSTIIEAAIRIHRAIGPGLLEKAYLGCLCFELYSAGVRIETQKALPLVYRGVNIDCAYPLRLADCPLGLLLDFGCETMRAGIKRVINGYPTQIEH
jgi:hypothetical protein